MRQGISAALVAGACVLAVAAPALAQTQNFKIPAGNLKTALDSYARQSGRQIIYRIDEVKSAQSPGASGAMNAQTALDAILNGSGFATRVDSSGAVAIVRAPGPVSYNAVQPGEAAPAAGSTGLEEIIVTAQRRGENLQRVPISVSAISATQLASAGITATGDIKLAVASADVPVASGFATPFIRGVGSKLIGPATEGAVATYVDNVYIGNTVAALLSFNNLARVEVLKGPQGTLFGRNTTGGLISVITRDPTDALQVNARVSYGNYQTLNGDLYIGGPIADQVKADIAAYAKHQGEGYGTNLFTGEDVGRTRYDFGLRSKWLLGEGPLTVKLTADYSKLNSSVFVQRVALGYTAPPAYAVGANYGGSPWDTDLTISPVIKTHSGGVSAKAEYEISPAVTLTSITAWRKSRYHNHFDADITRTDAREIDSIQTDEQFSQELQLLSGPASPFTWVVGAFLYDAQGRSDPSRLIIDGPARTAPGPFQGVAENVTYATQDVFSIAPYAQGTIDIFDATKLTLGLRYTYEKREQQGESRNFGPAGDQIGPTLVTPAENRRLTASKLTWRIAIDHQFGQNVLGYISYNRGFKSGGANLSNVTTRMYGPEQLDAYEVGVKSTLLDRRVRLNGAAFYYDYTDVQVGSVEAGIISVYNAATARTYGFELELNAQITRALRLNAGYTFLDAKFTDFPRALTNSANPAGGVTQTFQSAAGKKLPNAPESVITAGATYTVPIGSNTLTFNGNIYHSSSYFTEPDNFRFQRSYELYNASVEFTVDDRWSISVWGKNLSNEAVDLFPSVNGLGGGVGIPRSAFAPPRTYGATIGVKI